MNQTSRLRRRALIKCTAGMAAIALVPPYSISAQIAATDGWKAGDPLRLAGSVSGLTSLDPALARDLDSIFLLRQIYRGLMSLDANLQPQPCLAETATRSDDGRTYTFALRDNARFHDGRIIEARDVAASLTRALSPQLVGTDVSALAGTMYLQDIVGSEAVISGEADALAGIDVTDTRTLTITLEQLSGTFLMKLASVPASVVDTEQVSGQTWPTSPNGSGPFRVASWNAQESLELDASDQWWEGMPKASRIAVRLGASATQPFNLYQAGELDILRGVQSSLKALVEDPATGIGYGKLIESPVFATSYIAFGNQVEPLDDLHIRRALQAVFPASRIATATLDGSADVATGMVPPGMLGEDWEVSSPTVNVDVARAEIAKSRYGTADQVPPLTIAAADIQVVAALRDVVELELGLSIEALEVPWNSFVNSLSRREFPAYSLYWGADYPDPESMIDTLFATNAPDNYQDYRNEELDQLLAEARMADPDTRASLYARANQLLIDDAAVIPLYHPRDLTLVRAGIEGVVVTPMGLQGLEAVHAS